MLEIRNLTKIYKTRGGETRALDDVTLTFPETGMVFLLGKSGSGKSTLLNLCGGLDAPTSGEVVVYGRSSKTFSGSDFDSYRNTFIGFIFQEYNILSEFTVEENLAIALELQGKPKDKKKIERLLADVDLSGYGKRKPRTLSGGQKQRVAIARALIKDPKIIMADEPTGALDSATGKQVFDTLKKLSADRLIIVVSHDREFAEYYGDRIIELKDGKVSADVSKEKVASAAVSDNVTVIGEDVISVKKGSALTQADVERINEFLLKGDGAAIITRGEGKVKSFKKISRITDDDHTEQFADTDVKKISSREYGKEESAFVRSHLPIAKAAKMGAQSLRIKPFRLFLTVLLSVTAFIMFGVFSTLMTYNEESVIKDSFAASDNTVIALNKNYYFTRTQYVGDEQKYSFESKRLTAMTAADVKTLKKTINGVMPYFGFSDGYGVGVSVNNLSAAADTPRTMTGFSLYGFASAAGSEEFGRIVEGEYPSARDEIAISDFFASVVLRNDLYGISDDGSPNKDVIRVASFSALIDKKLSLRINGTYLPVTVKGIFDGGAMPMKFAGYDSFEKVSEWDYFKQAEYTAHLAESMKQAAFVSDGFYSYVVEKTGYEYREGPVDDYERFFDPGEYFLVDMSEYYVDFYAYRAYRDGEENMLKGYFFGSEKTALSGDEVLIPLDRLTFFVKPLKDERADEWASAYASYVEKASVYRDRAALVEGEASTRTEYENALVEYYVSVANAYQGAKDPCEAVAQFVVVDQLHRWNRFAPTVEDEVVADFTALISDYFTHYADGDGMSYNMRSDVKGSTGINIVGYYFDPSTSDIFYNTGLYVSEEKLPLLKRDDDRREVIETKYSLPESDVYFKGVYVAYGEGRKGNIDKILTLMRSRFDDDSCYAISSTLYSSIVTISRAVENLRQVFLYVGIGMAAFAALLLFNFISVSISGKMHEIGVLRAVGARGVDVFKIFFSESFIISLICILLSVGFTIGLVSYLNVEMSSALSFSIHLFVFGIIPLAMMVGVAFVVAFIGTFLPVLRIASKKPVDSMKG